MIQNDHELAVTRERVVTLERLLEALRKTARPEEWPALSSGYRLEIERMQGEILDYLKARRRHRRGLLGRAEDR
jgi:hypothetical protein